MNPLSTESQRYEQIVSKSAKTPVSTAGQTLQNLYGSVEQNHSVTPEINTQEDLAKQSAYIDYQKLMKYLNFANAAQGGGTLTAGDQIEAQNNYQSQLRSIESQYKDDTSDEETAVQQDYWNSLLRDTIDQKLGNFEVNEETGTISADDWNSLWSLYESKKSKMSAFQQEVMEFYLETIDHDETESTVIEQGNEGSGLAGKEFNGWVIGNEYGKMEADKTKNYKNGQIINEANAAHQQVYIYYNGYLYPAVKK